MPALTKDFEFSNDKAKSHQIKNLDSNVREFKNQYIRALSHNEDSKLKHPDRARLSEPKNDFTLGQILKNKIRFSEQSTPTSTGFQAKGTG